jgi:N-acetylglutamate synthase-like GNAT family acetyltransferase
MPGLILVLVAEGRDGLLRGVLEAVPPTNVLLDGVEAGVPVLAAVIGAAKVAKIRAVAVAENSRGVGIGATLIRRSLQVYLQLGFLLVYGQFPIGSGLEKYYARQGFTALDEGQDIDVRSTATNPTPTSSAVTRRSRRASNLVARAVSSPATSAHPTPTEAPDVRARTAAARQAFSPSKSFGSGQVPSPNSRLASASRTAAIPVAAIRAAYPPGTGLRHDGVTWHAAGLGKEDKPNLQVGFGSTIARDGRQVAFGLMWISVLIGAQPRKGKTFAARLLALYAAADPWVKVLVADGKLSADWRAFALVAETMIYGTHPNRDGDPVAKLLHLLRETKKHIMTVNEILSDLPASVCPEGKLTRELARDPKYPALRVWLLVMEEFQVYYELDDKEASGEIASLLSYIMAVGPSAGVSLISSSQKPSGIGAGQDVARLFTRYRDNHSARFALKCGNRLVSEAILGGDAYAEGFDASSLPNGEAYRGVGYLYGLTDATPTVRTYLADHIDAEKILMAAREHREKLGTLSGEAAGEAVIREIRDVLMDARAMLAPGETGIHWTALAERMADRLAEHYADLTAEAISSQLRAMRVPSVNIKRDGQTLKGCKTADLEAAITRRASA